MPAEHLKDSQTAADPLRRGRPRSETARHAIMDAACELLLTRGLADVSMDAVAERAGVSKATIYRWWPSKETLAMDALHYEWALTAGADDTGSLRSDLLALLRPWVREVRSRPYARVLAALIAEARSDRSFAREYLARLVIPRRDRARAVFTRAIERGEIADDFDVEVLLDLVYGPLYHRLFNGHAPLTDRFVRELVDYVLSGVLPRRSADTERETRRA